MIGIASGAICWYASTSLKQRLGYDDSLDVFGVHGVGGFIGTVLAGVFGAAAMGGKGLDMSIGSQVGVQLFAAIVTGTFVVERIFGIAGMGKHFVDSVNNRDYPIVMGVTLLYSVLLVIANLAVDITYAWLDPRIRYE